MATQTQSTDAVLTHHLKAFSVGLDELLKDYTDDSIIIGGDKPVRGRAGIRKFFEGLMTALPADFIPKLTVTKREIHGDVAYIAWNVPGFCPLGTDTFVMRNGKIAVQTFAFYVQPAK